VAYAGPKIVKTRIKLSNYKKKKKKKKPAFVAMETSFFFFFVSFVNWFNCRIWFAGCLYIRNISNKKDGHIP
jgi:hypothetical protein